jgi:competence protein ComEC
VKPFLRGQGVNSIRRFLLTHGDLKHIGATDLVRENFPAKTILTSAARFRSAKYREILSELHAHPEHWKTISSGDEFGAWKILHPAPEDQFSQADDMPLVLRGEFFGKSILLVSDLGRAGQNVLLSRKQNLKADIVVTGLPSDGEALSDELLDAIQPQTIVVMDAQFPANERASRKFRERLARRKVRVIYGREAGAVTASFQPEHPLEIKTAYEKTASTTSNPNRFLETAEAKQ